MIEAHSTTFGSSYAHWRIFNLPLALELVDLGVGSIPPSKATTITNDVFRL